MRSSLNVLEVIKKYRDTYPNIERRLLRTLVRMDYEIRTLKSSHKIDKRKEESFLKKLDRELDKAYPTSKTTGEPQTKIDNKHKPSKLEGGCEEGRTDQNIRELDADCSALQEMLFTRDGELSNEKRAMIERKWRKFQGLDKDFPDKPIGP